MPPQPAAVPAQPAFIWRLLLAVFKVYRIEERAFQGRAFQMLVTLALLALPVHYLAPFRWKKPLFVAVSMAGLFWVFGVQVAAIVLGFATVLIGICFLPDPLDRPRRRSSARSPRPWPARGRAWPRAVIPDNVWPIVASMFMFRMMIYLYELKHAKKPETLVDTLSYFFLLPNYCFMHFPVVDYRTMQRGYFADDVHAMQRRGLQMMFRGTVHLLLLSPGLPRAVDPGVEGARPGQPLRATWSATTCFISRSRASFTWPAACFTCSASSSPRRIITTCWRRVHRLLAADQHLLERLHGPALLQSGRVPAQAVAAAGWHWRWRP